MKTVSKFTATLGAGVLAATTLITAAAPASAAAAPASASDIHPMGGCRLGVICGTIFNNTNHRVKVCLDWHGPGTDQAYQTTDSKHYCADVAYAKPFSTYGAPQHKDIDAFYIPSGTSYYGAYAGIPKKWTHTKSGWWKFANTVDVHIDWRSGED